MKKIKLLLADDHQLIITGLIKLLKDKEDVEIVGQASNGKMLLQLVDETNPDLVITDIEMPVMDGVEAASQLKKSHPDLKIIILTMYNDKALTNQLLKIGVNGIIYKNSDENDFFTAIDEVMAEKSYYDKTYIKEAIKRKSSSFELINLLTEREKEIIKLVAEGNTNKEIAEAIFVSPRTVDTHRNNILKKLKLHNAVELTRFAFENGMV